MFIGTSCAIAAMEEYRSLLEDILQTVSLAFDNYLEASGGENFANSDEHFNTTDTNIFVNNSTAPGSASAPKQFKRLLVNRPRVRRSAPNSTALTFRKRFRSLDAEGSFGEVIAESEPSLALSYHQASKRVKGITRLSDELDHLRVSTKSPLISADKWIQWLDTYWKDAGSPTPLPSSMDVDVASDDLYTSNTLLPISFILEKLAVPQRINNSRPFTQWFKWQVLLRFDDFDGCQNTRKSVQIRAGLLARAVSAQTSFLDWSDVELVYLLYRCLLALLRIFPNQASTAASSPISTLKRQEELNAFYRTLHELLRCILLHTGPSTYELLVADKEAGMMMAELMETGLDWLLTALEQCAHEPANTLPVAISVLQVLLMWPWLGDKYIAADKLLERIQKLVN